MPSKPPRPETAAPAGTGIDADTIAAVATAPGFGGIGVVRVSGPRVDQVAEAVAGRRLPPRQAVYCTFRDDHGDALDQGIALRFPAPRSFTGEDVLELQGHGGPVVLQLLLDAVLAQGARLARPGEFTERAFVNGKLDLAQAEAVADLIASASAAAAQGALRSLQGEFSRAVLSIDEAVLQLRVYVEAAMDFPDEGADFLAEGSVDARLTDIDGALETLLRESRSGVLLRDGVSIALVGAPNVGKSSLLNRLAGQERAIVTEIPGTTRDLIHVDLLIDGLPVELVDTAGLRDTADQVELEGVRRARHQAAQADLVLLVQDDRDAAEVPAELAASPLIVVRNKADLSGAVTGQLPADAGPKTVRMSARTGDGVDALIGLIKQTVGFGAEGRTFTARRRHIEALKQGAAALGRARTLLAEGAPAELAAEELRAVHGALGSIVGEMTPDELLG
ncbi:MAG: tRNA uridine-5-carboxymethylaminomethyl(34) synthesis GTPase MnmE, partial [Pseudomonadales bacterium]